ncbi:tyrosine protein phosphatase 1, partial [Aureobasidium melanogenum]
MLSFVRASSFHLLVSSLVQLILTQQVWIVRVAKVSEIHVIHDSGRKRAIHLAEPSRGGLTQRCHGIGRIRRCLQNSGLDRTQKSDISRVREEVAMMLGVKLHVSPVNRRTVGVHVVGECQQRRFSIPICAMDENFSAFTTSTKIEINHANITITISVFRWTTLLCPSKHLPRPETTRLSISWKALLWQCGIWIGWHGQRRVRRRAEPHVVRYLGRRRHGVHLISLRVDFAHVSYIVSWSNEVAPTEVHDRTSHVALGIDSHNFRVLGLQICERICKKSKVLIGRNGTPELRVTEIASCLDDSYAAQSAGSASIMLLIARREVGQLNVVIGVQAMQPGEDSLSVWQGARRSVFQCFAELFSGQCIDGEGVSMTWLLPGASGDSGGVCSCCCFCSLMLVWYSGWLSSRRDCSHKSVGDGTFENSTSYVGLLANNSKDTEKTRGAISIASCSTQDDGGTPVHVIDSRQEDRPSAQLRGRRARKIVIFEAFV